MVPPASERLGLNAWFGEPGRYRQVARKLPGSLANGPPIRKPFFGGLTTPGARYNHGSSQTGPNHYAFEQPIAAEALTAGRGKKHQPGSRSQPLTNKHPPGRSDYAP